jgi:prevent-host-death family protein
MSRGRVLIVDDEPSVLKLYSGALTRAGFEVTGAASGLEALRRMEKATFDTVLSDHTMPKMNGLSLLGEMRARSLDASVILMLDAPDNRAAIRATELGALQSLVKPISVALLQKTVVHAVELHRSRKSIPAGLHKSHPDSLSAAPSITATAAKNEFGRLLEKVLHGGFMVITKHDTAKAVLISVDEFNEISNAPGRKLDTLSREFDALLAAMQKPKAHAGMKAAFGASPKQLGQAAVAAARKRA